MLETVALMILPPDLLSVMEALRKAMPNSMSLMFPIMLPRALWGPPDKERWYCYIQIMHKYTKPYIHSVFMAYLDRPECYTWTTVRSLLDMSDPRY